MQKFIAASIILILVLSYPTACSAGRPAPGQHGNSTSNNAISQPGSTSLKKPVRVILDHDGGVEELVAMVLLMQDPGTELLMVSYMEADSIRDVAVNTTLKLMHFINRTDVPLAVSTLQPQNPFPLVYRAGPLAADVLPALNPPDLKLQQLRDKVVVKQAGQDALTELLLKQQEPVTIVATGPLTNIAYALKKNPAVADKIARIWWMGGTLRHPGNIFNQSKSDGSAEWNVFADPAAAGVVWDSKVPLTLVPLDATNKVPITPHVLYRFGERRQSRLTQLVGSMFAPTVTWVYLTPHDPYYAWDTLNAACFLDPSLCKLQQETVQVVLEGPSQGALRVSGGSSSGSRGSSGNADSRQASSQVVALSRPKQVTAAVDANATRFEEFLLKALGRY